MTKPIVALLGNSIRSWLSAKGFWLVAAAALLPLVLTGAWVGAHQADLAVSNVTIPENLVEGQTVNLTATFTNTGSSTVGPFNASLAVGTANGRQFFPSANREVEVPSLEPGAPHTVTLEWNVTPGLAYALATVDVADIIGEKDEYNNQNATPLAASYAMPDANEAPVAPAGIAGDENATRTASLSIAAPTPSGGSLQARQAQTFTAVVTNDGSEAVTGANVTLRIGRTFGVSFSPTQTQTTTVDLEPGESESVTLSWTTIEGGWWAEAYVQPPADARDADASDNHATAAFTVDERITAEMQPPELPEKLTIKEFYVQVLTLLHLRILIPLIALFYAAGTVTDARDNGSLPYLLTRPLPRWLLPLTKFVASFIVASIAAIIGLALTYALLFGTTVQGGDVGFLVTPVLVVLLALFVYGALFTLLGVVSDRPYLIGVALVLGWENVATLFVPWVKNFTLNYHLGNAIAGWPLDQGLQWIPLDTQAAGSVRAFWLILVVGLGFLVGASVMMKRREFHV